MKTRLIISLFCLLIIAGCKKDAIIPPVKVDPPASTSLTISSVFQSNMVIQRDKPAKVWGKAPAGTSITIAASWQNTPVTVTTTSAGIWEATIPASAANASPQTITITAAQQTSIKLDNILIGDVWVCAGQSNMVMPVGPLAPSFAGVEDYATEIAAANYPEIRSLTVAENYESNPLADFKTPSVWKACSPANVGQLSATAYFFARKLHTDLNVPIGIIISAINGSWCETWTNKAALQADPFLSGYIGAHQSSMLFNGMIAPLTQLPIKGFTWYQGENNQTTNPASNYTKLNTGLIKGWRSEFNQGDLPFYYVQITPFDDGNTNNPSLNYLAKFREAQSNIGKGLVNVGMAVTMDAGEVKNHHPKYKKQVGDRLALLALNNAYGKNILAIGPRYESYTKYGNTVIIHFTDGTANGLSTLNNAQINQAFFVAGADKIFRQATAAISGNKILLTAPALTQLPVMSVRYAFTNYAVTNLQNNAGLPMEPFRTDDWDN